MYLLPAQSVTNAKHTKAVTNKKDDTINVGLLKTDFIYSMRKRLRPFLLIDKIIIRIINV